jgi:hypothetical protein
LVYDEAQKKKMQEEFDRLQYGFAPTVKKLQQTRNQFESLNKEVDRRDT